MKKFFIMIMAATMALCGITACNKTAPQYNSTKQFEIGMWVGVSDRVPEYDDYGKIINSRLLSEEEFLEKYQDIAKSGINIAFPGYDVMHDGRDYNLKALKAAKQVGIKQIIADIDLKKELLSAKDLVDTLSKTESEIVERIKSLISKYTSSDYSSALYGFMIQDEPSVQLFDALGYAEKLFKQAAPDLMFYVNLFPVIAGGAQLSGSSEPIYYDQYLTQWFSKIKNDYVSYDHYPLYGDGFNTSIEPSFLYNMDLMQTKIKEEGENRRLWTFLQSIQYGVKNRKLENKADASFQAYSFLAYGGNGIQWFCYAAPPSNDGNTHFENNSLVTRDYVKTPTYDYVSSVNHDIQKLMKYLGDFSWKGIMLSNVYDDTDNFGYLEESENVIENDNTLVSFKSEQDAFTGVFEDKNGKKGFMVINFTDPAKKIKNKVTMNFKNATNAIVVKEGQETIVKLSKGTLKLDMSEGDGFFVIPY